MKGKLTEIWLTFKKEVPQIPKYNAIVEPEEQLKLVQKAWEVLTD
jgi:hypothetical protein